MVWASSLTVETQNSFRRYRNRNSRYLDSNQKLQPKSHVQTPGNRDLTCVQGVVGNPDFKSGGVNESEREKCEDDEEGTHKGGHPDDT